MVEILPEADLVAVRPEQDAPDARLSKGALSWAVFEGARDPYVILIIIYIFMPYVASVMVGYPHGDPTRGQEVISQWSQYAGWATMATAPFLGASIDQMGRRKGWLIFCVAVMVPMTFSLWWAKPDGSVLTVTMVMLMTTVIGLLFSYTEVLHNSLLIRAAGIGGAHKASSLALALGNAFALVLLGFSAWAFVLPGKVDWGFVPKTPLFGLDVLMHEPERIVGPMSAILLLIGTIPILLFTPDAPKSGVSVVKAFADGARALWRMLMTVRNHRDAFIFLVSRSFYVDGMTAVLTFFGIYATGVMKWGALEMLVVGIILTVLAVIGGFLARWFDARLGPRRAVQMEILMSVFGIVALLGMAPDRIFFFWHYDLAAHAPLWNGPFFRTLPEWIFILIGFSNAVFITAHYASSRTLLTRLAPPDQTGAFFGAYAVSGTATVWLAPMLVNIGTKAFHTQQGGFAMIAILLAIGFVGLLFVRKGNADFAPYADGPIGWDDRGLLLGDGLFETLLARNGRLVLFEAHLARMTRGCAVMGLPPPDIAAARRACEAAAAGLDRAAVRLTLTAGSGGRGLDRPASPVPRMFATAAPASPVAAPARLAAAATRRNQASPASRLKTLSYLDNVLARREAQAAGADEAVMLNGEGHIACAAAANLFWSANGRLFTPATDCGVLDGVVRGEVIAAAARDGVEIALARSGAEALAGAEAIYLTNSLIGVRAASTCDGRPLAPSRLDARMAAWAAACL